MGNVVKPFFLQPFQIGIFPFVPSQMGLRLAFDQALVLLSYETLSRGFARHLGVIRC